MDINNLPSKDRKAFEVLEDYYENQQNHGFDNYDNKQVSENDISKYNNYSDNKFNDEIKTNNSDYKLDTNKYDYSDNIKTDNNYLQNNNTYNQNSMYDDKNSQLDKKDYASEEIIVNDKITDANNNTHHERHYEKDFDNVDKLNIKNKYSYNTGNAYNQEPEEIVIKTKQITINKQEKIPESSEYIEQEDSKKATIESNLLSNEVSKNLEDLKINDREYNESTKVIEEKDVDIIPPSEHIVHHEFKPNNDKLIVLNKQVPLTKKELLAKNKEKVLALLLEGNNNFCFDCSKPYPLWAHVTLGIFICSDCALLHKVEFKESHNRVKSLEVCDFVDRDVEMLSAGGNDRLAIFLRYYGIESKIINIRLKYLYVALVFYVKQLVRFSKGKEISTAKPNIEDGLRPATYKQIEGALGFVSLLKDRVKEFVGYKSKEEVKSEHLLNAQQNQQVYLDNNTNKDKVIVDNMNYSTSNSNLNNQDIILDNQLKQKSNNVDYLVNSQKRETY